MVSVQVYSVFDEVENTGTHSLSLPLAQNKGTRSVNHFMFVIFCAAAVTEYKSKLDFFRHANQNEKARSVKTELKSKL